MFLSSTLKRTKIYSCKVEDLISIHIIFYYLFLRVNPETINI